MAVSKLEVRPGPGRRSLRFLGWFILALVVLAGVYVLALRPWSLRWGASDAEIGATLPGDELMARAERQVTRAISIKASPEKIWPWLVQMGAGRGGFYSYDWLETNLLRCPITNAKGIIPELQHLKLGDPLRLCPEGSGPPMVYTVGRLDPGQALVMGVREAQDWGHTWAFVLQPLPDGFTRLIVRSRTATEQSWQKLVEPGEFIMERGMMLGIKQRAEKGANP